MPMEGECVRCGAKTVLPPDMSKGIWMPVDMAAGKFICPRCQQQSI